MGWLSVLISVIAGVLLYGTGRIVLLTLAIISAIGCFWSWGVMHNYATGLAKRRKDYRGGFYDITKGEAKSVPNWITWINMGFSLLSFILLIIGIFMKIT